MNMRVGSSMASMWAQLQLTQSQSAMRQTIERLSSGLRINSAADDPAGLGISTRYNSLVNSEGQSILNANNAISMLQTADGAAGSITRNLQRIRQLALQSINATNSAADRRSLQIEVGQLATEIDRIGVDTQFNQQKVFDQGRDKRTGLANAQLDAVVEGLQGGWLENSESMIQKYFGISAQGQTIDIDLTQFTDGAGGTAAQVTSMTAASGPGKDIKLQVDLADFKPPNLPNGGTAPLYADRIIAHEMVHAVMATGQSWGELCNQASTTWFREGVAEFIVGADERVESDIADNGGGGVAGAGGAAVATNIGGGGWSRDSLAYSSAYVAVRYLDYTIKSKGGKGVGDMLQYLQNNKGKNLDDAFANASHQAFASNAAFLADIAKGGSQTFMRNVMNDAMLANDDTGSVGGSDVTGKPANELTAESVLNDFGSRSGTQTMTGFKEKWDDDLSSADGSANILSFLVGPNAGQTISTNIGAMNLGALGLGDLDVTDPDSASLAVRHIDQALSYVDNNRARMGAQMSRFQQTIGYLQTSSLNHQAALSRMRDADLAAEMSALGRAQILQSAAQAMVAQANQASRLLLQLLQHP